MPDLPGIAVVGARKATPAGLEVGRRIGAELGRRGVTVVSGFARGVDGAAHRGCLAAGGRTVAVLGCGLGVDYPPQHRALRTEVSLMGALVSEYTSYDTPKSWHFPERNRIIAALSRAVVVVEAGAESGALSTARWAADLGREVLAVPGSILSPANAGANRLLRDGARPYLDVSDLADVVAACGVAPARATEGTGTGGALEARRGPGAACRLLDMTCRLLDMIGAEPAQREVLGRAMGLGAAELAVLLGELELAGSVRSLPGGLITRGD